MTTSFLLVVQIVLTLLLTVAVLLQKSSSIGLGAYSGSNDSVFGAKGANSFLTKTTFLIGFLFVINTLLLGYLYAQESNKSVVDGLVKEVNITAPVVAPTTAMPLSENNISMELNSSK